jgi:hypothetical protein
MMRAWLRRWLGCAADAERLRNRLDTLESALERRRVLNFVHTVKYTKDMDLRYAPRAAAISLEDLERRITELEGK